MDDLIAFLREQLDARERRIAELRALSAEDLGLDEPWKPKGHDAALADVAAKREIVSLVAFLLETRQIQENAGKLSDYSLGRAQAGGAVLRRLALPYAHHPDYREEWKP